MLNIPTERLRGQHWQTMGASEVEKCHARLATLSDRERAVLDHSLTGRTDEQIAQALSLSIATISTYWARIRSKLGHLSRTELVSMVLRYEALEEHARLLAEIQCLRDEVRRHKFFQSLRDTPFEDSSESTWHSKALLYSPDATLVIAANGEICFANTKAKELLLAAGQDLGGVPLRDFTMMTVARGREIEPCRSLFHSGNLVEREILGIEQPCYVRRRDGTNFRAVLQSQRFFFRDEPMATMIVREYLGEAEMVMQALRNSLDTHVPDANGLIFH